MKWNRPPTVLCATAALALLATTACRRPQEPEVHDEKPPPSNRIAVPAIVRANLGIEFQAVERRRVAATLRVPGHFELLPQGRREYRAQMQGRVEVAVRPLQRVAAGDVLCTLDAPAWRMAQRELGELLTAATVAEARIAAMEPLLVAHDAHESSLGEAVAVTLRRIDDLEATRRDIGGQAPELAAARVQLAQLRAELAEAQEKHADLVANLAEQNAELRADRDRFALALEVASTLAGQAPALLLAPVAGSDAATPTWRNIGAIAVSAVGPGVIDRLPVTSGAWVEVGDLIAAVTDVAQVRFVAHALQSDLGLLINGLPAHIEPPYRSGERAPATGVLVVGSEADPVQRTVELFVEPEQVPAWALPGVAGFLSIETRRGGDDELAIPLAAVMQDGLQRVFFRRDPADPDRVIRVEADLGVDDGRWVEVKSGLRDGDAVVLAGAYELLLASSGTSQRGGHFHADGQFHEDGHK